MELSIFFENNRKEKNKQNKFTRLARSKLNSIEKIISHALLDSDISHKKIKHKKKRQKD